MRNYLFIAFFAILYCTSVGAQTPLTLWYDRPAEAWEEALPLGNGRLGAMVFGDPSAELYQLNELSLWSGSPKEENNPKAALAMSEIRSAVNRGDYQEAGQLWRENAQGPYSARYQPLADLKISTPNKHYITNLHRELSLEDALSTVRYTANGVNYKRTSFISHPDEVMVVKIEADQAHAINLDIELTSQLQYTSNVENGSRIVIEGIAPKYVAHRPKDPNQLVYGDDERCIRFRGDLQVVAKEGTLKQNGHRLKVISASEVTLVFSAATNYGGIDATGKPILDVKRMDKSASYVNSALEKSFEDLLSAHTIDYKRLFSRVSLALKNDKSIYATVPTDERLKRFLTDDSDLDLVTLYYQFGRYLAISSSRTEHMPSNLQGIWNHRTQPRWGSNYTLNINTEMNYWLTEVTNLPELSQPLFNFLKQMSIRGKETAKVNYGMDKGWVAHHNSDVWAKTAPTGNFDQDLENSMASWSAWPMASGWLVQQLWKHYEFNGDRTFLKETAYPLMKGAAEFMLQWLQWDDELEAWVTNPSTSPENIFLYKGKNGEMLKGEVSKAATMDMAIIWDLFHNCIRASEVLKVDNSFRNQLKKVNAKLFPYQIGKRGQLQEWFLDFEEFEPEHRHASHLLGLYPGIQIQPRVTPELASAAKKTLLLRGDGGTGWAMAWKISFWARLEDGNHAYQILKNGLTYTDPSKQNSTSGGGTYPNLFDAHPPFQIDGNFGGTVGITEMLIQSHTSEIHLLPALPSHWAKGEVKGLKAKGGFTIDLAWENGKVKTLKIHSEFGGNCRLRLAEKLESDDAKLKNAKGLNSNSFYPALPKIKFDRVKSDIELEDLNLRDTHVIDFSTVAGETYLLTAK